MRDFKVRCLESLAELRAYAALWDDLWLRSGSTRPTARAEMIAILCEAFAPRQAFRAIVVEQEGRFVAALPLVLSRRWGVPMASTPGNAWSPSGELLVDHGRADETIYPLLLDKIQNELPGVLVLDGIVPDSQNICLLREHLEATGIVSRQQLRFAVPLVQVTGTWSGYLKTRSRNQRRQIRVLSNRAQALGSLRLDRYENLSPEDVEPRLLESFELEQQGWKGRSESAVLNEPAAWAFFLRQAQHLASQGELALAVLRDKNQPIAFEYGWQTRGVRGVLKIGYCEKHSYLSPGQLLRQRLLRRLFDEQRMGWVDFIGPINQATRVWSTHSYEVGRLQAALGNWPAALAIQGYQLARRFSGSRPAAEVAEQSPISPAPPNAFPLPETAAFPALSAN